MLRQALLLAMLAAGAAGVEREPMRMHTVFGAECNHYFDWQSIGVVYSHRKAGVPGPITRCAAGRARAPEARRSWGFPAGQPLPTPPPTFPAPPPAAGC